MQNTAVLALPSVGKIEQLGKAGQVFLWTNYKTDITAAGHVHIQRRTDVFLMASFSPVDSALFPNGKEKLLSVQRENTEYY
ncbi:uncharacterized [Tachysurus ichikawai]